MSKVIETDLKTFIKFWLVPLGIAIALFLIVEARVGLIIIGISIFLALALRPLVRLVNKFFVKHLKTGHEHQKLSAVMAYVIVVVVVGGILAIVGPVVVNETAKFVQSFPQTFEDTIGGWDGINNFGKSIGVENLTDEVFDTVEGYSHDIVSFLGTNIIASVGGVVNALMEIFIVLVLTLLFLLEGPDMIKSFWDRIDARRKSRGEEASAVRHMFSRMGGVISTYVSRQVAIALLDGSATAIIVFILTLALGLSPSLALPMGMITMFFYLIPMFGQFIGGTTVTLLLLFSNPLAALIFAVSYIIYTQIENNAIVPKIQGNAMRLRPVLVLCAVTIGVYTFGLLGAIVAIPVAGCIKVFAEEFPKIKASKE